MFNRSLAFLVALFAAACTHVAPQPNTPPVTFQDRLRDDLPGPEMVVIPAGEFEMGSPAGEDGRYADEGPQHRVIFEQPFAIGRFEITVGQFREFVRATGYVTEAEQWLGSYWRSPTSPDWELLDANWRHDSRGLEAADGLPVVHVTWNDAQTFVRWLADQTNQPYRLPSEAEFEYANRAGTVSRFWWGNHKPPTPVANLRGSQDRVLADQSWSFTEQEVRYILADGEQPLEFSGYGDGSWWPTAAGALAPNPFGLYDTTGNVWEWTADCWHDTYVNAPSDGSAWIESGDCESRVVRGGSYYCAPRHVRSANRWRRWKEIRAMYLGFRVARNLSFTTPSPNTPAAPVQPLETAPPPAVQ